MSTLDDEQADAIRTMLVEHARNASPRRRGWRIAVAGLLVAGVGAGFAAGVASGSTVNRPEPAQSNLIAPVSFYVTQVPEFARPQQPEDIPPEIPGFTPSTFTRQSFRYAGEFQGVKYYLTLSGTRAKPTSINILVVSRADLSSYVIGGASALPFTVNGRFAPVLVLGNGRIPPAGATRLSQSVFVDPSSVSP